MLTRMWILALLAAFASGCQLIPVATEEVGDFVDYTADKEYRGQVWDRYYHPAFDLTRIGR